MFVLALESMTAMMVALLMMVGLFAIIGLFFMQAGLIRARNINDLILKNITLFAIVVVFYIFLSSHFELSAWTNYLPNLKMIRMQASTTRFYGEMMLEMTLLMFAVSVITGATAERLRFWPMILFTMGFLICNYPLEVFWVWGNGFLKQWGFIDQTGASVIHLNSSMAALAGVLIIGTRRGKYDEQNKSLPLPGANIPLSALGMCFIWLGFVALNLATLIYQPSDINAFIIFKILTNTLLAGGSGIIFTVFFSRIIFGVVDLTLLFNGLLAGLTAITAAPDKFSNSDCILLGCAATLFAMILLYLFDKGRLDDPCGLIATQFAGSVMSLLGVGFWHPKGASHMLIQCAGILIIMFFSFGASIVLWWIVRIIIGLRIHPDDEYKGLDVVECGMVAYPEFTTSNWEK